MSNAKIVRTSKLVDGVDIDLKKYDSIKVSIKEYDPSELTIGLDNFDASFNEYKLPVDIVSRPGEVALSDMSFVHQTGGDNDEIPK